ncbi:uncharacterized protein LOC108953664 [Musa acuminata AAA Group]|uniref:uncharacterized protein LOC108953664 n=1 Tax=Musa acuminata AAA Group TaxID=214697 RepID=UPI0031D4E69E
MAQSPEGAAEAAALSPHDPRQSQDWEGCSLPHSFPSQPPDISNWFSSYVYESPDSLGLPDSLGSPLLLEEDESQTQEPVDGSSTSKDCNLVDFPKHGRNSYHNVGLSFGSCKQAGSFMLKENNQDSLLGDEGKSCRRNDDVCSDYGNRSLDKSSASSDKRILERTNCHGQISHQESDTNGLSPKQWVEDDGFVSVKSKDRSRASDILKMLPNQWNDCSNRNKNTGRNKKEWIGETDHVQPKRKQNLKKLLGEELLATLSEEKGGCLPSSASGSECTSAGAAASLVQNKSCDRTDGRNWFEDSDIMHVDNTKKKQEKDGRRCKEEGGVIGPTSMSSMEQPEDKNGAPRSPLGDKSNHQAMVAAASEIPGKWRCPRKAKVDMGPPKKQLRLDRWFHLSHGRPTIT